jgi:hypothetical protein
MQMQRLDLDLLTLFFHTSQAFQLGLLSSRALGWHSDIKKTYGRLQNKGVDTRKDALADLVSISLEKKLTPYNIFGRFPVGMDLGN